MHVIRRGGKCMMRERWAGMPIKWMRLSSEQVLFSEQGTKIRERAQIMAWDAREIYFAGSRKYCCKFIKCWHSRARHPIPFPVSAYAWTNNDNVVDSHSFSRVSGTYDERRSREKFYRHADVIYWIYPLTVWHIRRCIPNQFVSTCIEKRKKNLNDTSRRDAVSPILSPVLSRLNTLSIIRRMVWWW